MVALLVSLAIVCPLAGLFFRLGQAVERGRYVVSGRVVARHPSRAMSHVRLVFDQDRP